MASLIIAGDAPPAFIGAPPYPRPSYPRPRSRARAAEPVGEAPPAFVSARRAVLRQ
mgnify:CR=1 FL=1